MILVCSATGKVGQEVVKCLQAAGVPFNATSSDLERARKTLDDDVKLTLLNYDQSETYAPALEGVTRLFILHPQDAPGRIVQLRAFIDVAKTAGVQQVVYMSALGANEQPNDPMHLLEQHIAASGLTYTFLRPNWFMQNFSTQELRRIKEKGTILSPTGDKKLTFIDTRHIGAAAAHILINGGHERKAYTLMGSEAYSYTEVAAMISEVAGRTITHESPEVEAELSRMRERDVPQEFIDFMAWLFADIHRGLTAQHSGDVQDILGRPPITFRQYLQDYAHVWRE
jgi:uncharacterized protein YbjT (DUF2867 family)